ncbi:electron transport complex subunit RsxB [Larsenimonas suaedae]|uniref:Electron transport complex subunit RsxB n=1 Tax=Larsenimonas suaedae TaxID=1851019 RepID=A0ABU1GYW2_9GAMM|nr:electron transport complex subunit RsxB [Larsenimonas suaedae]MCM2971495.1 electron transport complex subunit RsxB [Larsenimonas suaedae]MDR5896751.1 electron transport complex subunit RsxB [Larsenimonas suaedae]
MNAAIVLIDDIDAVLPQTQCGKCGHPGCRPYARAIAEGEAINKCPPGGQATVARLADLLELEEPPLAVDAETPQVAVIREDECIGCTKCIKACPVDAIVGASKQMHTVIEPECTGCELCIAPCPVDCIDLIIDPAWQGCATEHEQRTFLDSRAELARRRYEAHTAREDARRTQRKRSQNARQGDSTLATEAATPALDHLDMTDLKAARAAAQARLGRFERQLKRVDEAERRELEHRHRAAKAYLGAIEQRLDALNAPTQMASTEQQGPNLKQLRIALKAAETTEKQAQKQLKRLEIKGTAEQAEAARAQLERAYANTAAAQKALEQAEAMT